MTKDEKKPESKKPFIERYKNAKFIFLNLLVLTTLAFALFSGDGGNIFSNYYQKVTGQKLESFSPVTELSSQSYQILKYKLNAEHIDIASAKIDIFTASDSSHKYRVTIGGQTLLFSVEKQANGIWQIKQVAP